MAELKDVLVPDIDADEACVTEILVATGNQIEEEQGLISVVSDNASMDVLAPFAGTVKEIKLTVEDNVSQSV